MRRLDLSFVVAPCGLALALVLSACGGDDGGACPAPSVSCAGFCVEVTSDTGNCGGCGLACATGQACVGGVCQAPPCTGAGLMQCGTACVRTATDPLNCGGCGNTCVTGELCVAAACQRSDCPSASELRCLGACTDLMTDRANCGACGSSCRPDQLCNAAACGCPLGQSECGGGCRDLSSDPGNCGLCGVRCPSTEACVDGVCVEGVCDRAPFARCGAECVDTRVDPRHCGGCGIACGPGRVCGFGRCDCGGGATLCGDACVDTSRDERNCGACGAACGLGETCSAGTCVGTTCPDGLLDCGGACVDPSTDTSNCGTCGTRCLLEMVCASGVCVSPMCEQTCGGMCFPLDDPRHCGRCDNPVPPGAVCRGGTFACPDGTVDCDGRADRLFCMPTGGAAGCDACNAGTGCGEGAYCIRDACLDAPVTAMQIACGGPYAAGSAPVQCRAYLVFDPSAMLEKLEVTTSPFVTWTEAGCTGPTCDPDGNGNDPELVEGAGTTPMAGLFTPAGAASPATVTAETVSTVTVRFTRGALDVSATALVRTQPPM